MPRTKRLRKPEKTRLWKAFLDVNPDDWEDVRRFCSSRNFMLMLEDSKGVQYARVDQPDCEVRALQEFRRWHQDFKKNVAPAANEAQRLIDKSRLSKRQENRLRHLLNFLSAKSYLYGSYVSPMLPPISQNDWPARRAVQMQYAPAYPGIVGGPYVEPEGRTSFRKEIEKMSYENAEAASYLADMHTGEIARDFCWAGTVTTVGHVFVDLIQDLEGRGPILKCAVCGNMFSGNAYQRRHDDEGHNVYCPECSGIKEGPRVYRRRQMAWWRRHSKDKGKSHEATSRAR